MSEMDQGNTVAPEHRTVTPSPFVPGARVAIETQAGGWRSPMDFKEGFVEKVHKNGNFTLKGSAQQFRCFEPGSFETFWRAGGTGQSNVRLRIWNDTTDAEIRSKMARASLYRRFHAATSALDRVAFDEKVTREVVMALEAAVAALSAAKGET